MAYSTSRSRVERNTDLLDRIAAACITGEPVEIDIPKGRSYRQLDHAVRCTLASAEEYSDDFPDYSHLRSSVRVCRGEKGQTLRIEPDVLAVATGPVKKRPPTWDEALLKLSRTTDDALQVEWASKGEPEEEAMKFVREAAKAPIGSWRAHEVERKYNPSDGLTHFTFTCRRQTDPDEYAEPRDPEDLL